VLVSLRSHPLALVRVKLTCDERNNDDSRRNRSSSSSNN
jgi:hypothetical protein